MIFTLPKMVAYTSKRMNFLPGDMILSGSPADNGKHHNQFMKVGDIIVVAITGLGKQTNICRKEPTPELPLAFGHCPTPED